MARFSRNSGALLRSALPIGVLLLAVGFQNSDLRDSSAAQVTQIEMAAHSELAPNSAKPVSVVQSSSAKPNYDFTSGPRSSDEIDEEWLVWTGASEAINLDDLVIEDDLRLTAILTEFQDLSKNTLRVVHIVSLEASTAGKTNSVTFYNRAIDGLEEKMLRSSLAIPHRLVKSEDGLGSAMTDRSYFSVSMQQSILKRPFDLRPPNASGEFAIANDTDFDPIKLLLAATVNRDTSTFESEVFWADTRYTVQAEAKETEFGTLVIELHVRAVDSLQTQKIALIYE